MNLDATSGPHIVSRVNGMVIPIQPGQAGIMHRFEQPINQITIGAVNENGVRKARDTDNMFVSSATVEPVAPPVL